MQDQKRLLAKKSINNLKTEAHHLFTDCVADFVKGGIKLCEWTFR